MMRKFQLTSERVLGSANLLPPSTDDHPRPHPYDETAPKVDAVDLESHTVRTMSARGRLHCVRDDDQPVSDYPTPDKRHRAPVSLMDIQVFDFDLDDSDDMTQEHMSEDTLSDSEGEELVPAAMKDSDNCIPPCDLNTDSRQNWSLKSVKRDRFFLRLQSLESREAWQIVQRRYSLITGAGMSPWQGSWKILLAMCQGECVPLEGMRDHVFGRASYGTTFPDREAANFDLSYSRMPVTRHEEAITASTLESSRQFASGSTAIESCEQLSLVQLHKAPSQPDGSREFSKFESKTWANSLTGLPIGRGLRLRSREANLSTTPQSLERDQHQQPPTNGEKSSCRSDDLDSRGPSLTVQGYRSWFASSVALK